MKSQNEEYNPVPDLHEKIASLESQLRDSALLYQNVVNSNLEKDEEIDRLKDLFEKRGSAMQDLSEQVGLLSTKSDELREALRESVDRLDRSSKTHYYCAAILQSVGLTDGDEPLSMAQNEIAKTLDKCRKLIGD